MDHIFGIYKTYNFIEDDIRHLQGIVFTQRVFG